MNKRHIAILNINGYDENAGKLAAEFSKLGDVTVFYKNKSIDFPVDCVEIPSECDTEVKARNFINRRFREAGFTGFLHVVSDGVALLKTPVAFISDLETMMTVLDYGVWFNTVCDGCNYVYAKYNPRMYVDIDIPEISTKLGICGRLNFTSHSNQQWIAYDFKQVTDDQLRFDDRFTISMFWIIEFLARRRNTKSNGSLYFMNYYLTVDSERGVFENCLGHDNKPQDSKIMQAEDSVFRSMRIKYEPDSNIDMILEDFWKKIKEKTEKPV